MYILDMKIFASSISRDIQSPARRVLRFGEGIEKWQLASIIPASQENQHRFQTNQRGNAAGKYSKDVEKRNDYQK